MKKIYFLAGAVAALVAVSCAKEQGKVDNPSPTPAVTEEEDTTPVPILFGSKLNTVETKAAVEKWNDAHSPQSNALYIYGLEDAGTVAAPVYKLTSKTRNEAPVTEAFINNVKAVPPAGATADVNSTRSPISVFNPDGAKNNQDQLIEPFYYAENVKYNFFGYYVDDAFTGENPTPDVEATNGTVSKITLPVTINGTQDILLAKTDKEEDLINKAASDKAIGSIDRLYSSYSARRGVNPNLNFEHQLSRFVFSVKKGGTVNSDDIKIKSLKVESYTKGTLTIVGNPTEVPNQKWNTTNSAFEDVTNSSQNLYLFPDTDEDREYLAVTTHKEINTQPIDTPIIAENVDALNIHPGADYATIGDIMVYPGQDVYNFDLDIKQAGITAPIPTQHLQIEMAKVIKNGASAGVQFAEPGKQYNVNLIVYGAEEVVITVTLSDWEEVGEINIDPDEQDEIDSYVPTLTLTAPAIEVGGAGSTASVAVEDKNGDPVTPASVTFASRNTNVATVDAQSGAITAVAAGTTKIVAYITITGVQGTLVASANLTVNPAALPTAVVTAHTDVSAWTFVANYAGTIATISGSATVNNVDVDGGTWSYSVDPNDYFEVDGDGKVTLKDGAGNPDPNPVVITFTVTLNDKPGVYNGDSDTVTITVNPA